MMVLQSIRWVLLSATDASVGDSGTAGHSPAFRAAVRRGAEVVAASFAVAFKNATWGDEMVRAARDLPHRQDHA